MKTEIRKNTIATMVTDKMKEQIIRYATKENKSTSQFIHDVLGEFLRKHNT